MTRDPNNKFIALLFDFVPDLAEVKISQLPVAGGQLKAVPAGFL
jgi:hypothetical protein